MLLWSLPLLCSLCLNFDMIRCYPFCLITWLLSPGWDSVWLWYDSFVMDMLCLIWFCSYARVFILLMEVPWACQWWHHWHDTFWGGVIDPWHSLLFDICALWPISYICVQSWAGMCILFDSGSVWMHPRLCLLWLGSDWLYVPCTPFTFGTCEVAPPCAIMIWRIM